MSNRNRIIVAARALALGVLVASQTFADVAPPVKIRLSKRDISQAIPLTPYRGVVEVLVGSDGTIDDAVIEGRGWTIASLNPEGALHVRAGETVRYEFAGVPAQAFEPLRFVLHFDGVMISRRIDLTAERFAREGKAQKVASLDDAGRVHEFAPRALYEGRTASGQQIHFHGRIAYQRPTSMSDGTPITVGADGIWFQIRDDDSPDPFDETIYEGLTDRFGYFDVTVNWSDCDITGCDDPDIYIRWETDNGVVNVVDADLFEARYSWSTQDNTIDDFTGSDVDFGTLMPGDSSQYPAIHIHNSIMRAHRFILTNDGTNVTELNVLWPEDETGSGAYYQPDAKEIHLAPSRQWNEDTHTHEYGHHFMEMYSVNTAPDYANGICDTDSPGHCIWCDETDHDAWNEGWPNWLADVVTRSYPIDYAGYMPLTTRSQEAIQTNCGCCISGYPCCFLDSMPNNPFLTEGYAGALLCDIEDSTQDDHDGDGVFVFDCNTQSVPPDCDVDAMALGTDEIFAVVKIDKPATIQEFIDDFRDRYPQYDQDLLSTLRNVATPFSATFTLSPPNVVSQSQGCFSFLEGDVLNANVQGDGSLLRYQWRRDGTALSNDARTSGVWCPSLMINPLQAGDSGLYDARVDICNGGLGTISNPIRVNVFAGRGIGNLTYAWGRNDTGQLGVGYVRTGPVGNIPPEELDGLSDAIAISSGDWHSLALKSDGTVVSWGANAYGELGIGSFGGSSNNPVPVLNLVDVVAVAAGGEHSMALKADGSVWAWGYGGYGLGDGTGSSQPSPIIVPDLSCVVAIAAGTSSSFALKADGTVWAWGWSYHGELGPQATIGGPGSQLGVPTEVTGITDATAITTGLHHVLARRANGTLLAWGRNVEGALGNGGATDTNIPTPVLNVSNVVAIGAGDFTSTAIVADGTVWGWGSKSGGQLCDGAGSNRYIPSPIIGLTSVRSMDGGRYHSIFLHDGGTVTTCGWNTTGEVGPLPQYAVPPGPYSLPGVSGVRAVAAGTWQSYALPTGLSPLIRVHPTSRTVLAGQSTTFATEIDGVPTLTAQWQKGLDFLVNGENISGVNTTALNISPVRVADAGSFSITVVNSIGSVTSMEAVLTVTPLPGDRDGDADVDLDDFPDFTLCMSRVNQYPNPPAGGPTVQECLVAYDFDRDFDVDLDDFAQLQVRFGQ